MIKCMFKRNNVTAKQINNVKICKVNIKEQKKLVAKGKVFCNQKKL